MERASDLCLKPFERKRYLECVVEILLSKPNLILLLIWQCLWGVQRWLWAFLVCLACLHPSFLHSLSLPVCVCVYISLSPPPPSLSLYHKSLIKINTFFNLTLYFFLLFTILNSSKRFFKSTFREHGSLSCWSDVLGCEPLLISCVLLLWFSVSLWCLEYCRLFVAWPNKNGTQSETLVIASQVFVCVSLWSCHWMPVHFALCLHWCDTAWEKLWFCGHFDNNFTIPVAFSTLSWYADRKPSIEFCECSLCHI